MLGGKHGVDARMAKTPYATPLKSADVKDCRIERILINASGEQEIRFSWWPNGKFVPRPLDLPERELLPLIREAIREDVFERNFLVELRDLLNENLNAHRP
jgi:hypothetical protein